jgi:hypothetical protein
MSTKRNWSAVVYSSSSGEDDEEALFTRISGFEVSGRKTGGGSSSVSFKSAAKKLERQKRFEKQSAVSPSLPPQVTPPTKKKRKKGKRDVFTVVDEKKIVGTSLALEKRYLRLTSVVDPR